MKKSTSPIPFKIAHFSDSCLFLWALLERLVLITYRDINPEIRDFLDVGWRVANVKTIVCRESLTMAVRKLKRQRNFYKKEKVSV